MEQIAPLPPTQAPTPASLGPQVTPASHAKRHMGGVTVTRAMLRSGDKEGVQKLKSLWLAAPLAARHVGVARLTRALSLPSDNTLGLCR